MEQNTTFLQISNTNWLRDMKFFIDIMLRLAILNVFLQDKNILIHDPGQKLFSFQNKRIKIKQFYFNFHVQKK